MKIRTKNSDTHPPKASLTIRIGVTGHRPNGLRTADMQLLRENIREVLSEINNIVRQIHNDISQYYIGSEPLLRIISPLAEGSDRIAAQEAIYLGYELQCPLPFEQKQYEKDFTTGESRVEFLGLLEQATATLELDGQVINKDAAYHAVGKMVLNQCDILIAVWDGEESRGPGGTAQIVKEARLNMIPVIWINAERPHNVSLIDSADGWKEAVRQHLEQLIAPSLDYVSRNENETTRLIKTYFNEKQRKINWGCPYKIFRDFFGDGKLKFPQIRLNGFQESTEDEWRQVWDQAPEVSPDLITQINKKFLKYYAWADKLADYYANLYRSSFLTIYIFSGVAVLCALLSYALHSSIPVIAEILTISLIVFVISLAGRFRWHRRWIDYRILAELLRNMRYLAPLGLVTASFRIPAHASNDDVNSSWVNWYFRSVVREAGLLHTRIDAHYLSAYRNLIKNAEIQGQIEFHENSSKRYHKICHRLHNTGYILFGITFVAAAAHLFYHGEYSKWLTVIAAVFPAFGAAFTGIFFQGEFERLEQRSKSMYNRLMQLYDSQIRPSSPFEDLQLLAEETAECMMTEVLDWHLMFRSRPLKLPS